MMNILHFSFDDTAHTLHDLCVNRYASVFDQPFLHALREVHRETGAVFTLFCFNCLTTLPEYDIDRLPDCYQAELSAQRHWLRFGFHAEDDTSHYAVDAGAQEAIRRCNAALRRLAGEAGIDPMVRLGFCSANPESMAAVMHEGVRGLYAADDARLNYDLKPEQNDVLIHTGRYDDNERGLVFIQSLPRLDKRTANDVIPVLDTWMQPLAEVFMHEYSFLADPDGYRACLTAIARRGSELGYRHGFHSDVLFR